LAQTHAHENSPPKFSARNIRSPQVSAQKRCRPAAHPYAAQRHTRWRCARRMATVAMSRHIPVIHVHRSQNLMSGYSSHTSSQVKPRHLKSSQGTSSQAKAPQVKPRHLKSSQVTSSHPKSSQVKSKVKSNQVASSLVSSRLVSTHAATVSLGLACAERSARRSARATISSATIKPLRVAPSIESR